MLALGKEWQRSTPKLLTGEFLLSDSNARVAEMMLVLSILFFVFVFKKLAAFVLRKRIITSQ